MKKLSIILSFLFLAACNGNKKNGEIPPTEIKTIAVFTFPDSSKILEIGMRITVDSIKYDSVKRKKIVISKTICGIPKMVPVKDSITKKDKVDSLGQKVMEQIWVIFPCDSMKIKGIEGVPISELLSKKAPLQ